MSVCASVCLSGAPPVAVNMAADALSRGAPSTVIAPTGATEEPPATAVSTQQHGMRRSIKCLVPKI